MIHHADIPTTIANLLEAALAMELVDAAWLLSEGSRLREPTKGNWEYIIREIVEIAHTGRHGDPRRWKIVRGTVLQDREGKHATHGVICHFADRAGEHVRRM